MTIKNLIPANEFCASYGIEISFINSLQATGLIEITFIDDTGYIQVSQLPRLEKIVRLYYELDINVEGIETVTHLLQRINELQSENNSLRNRLRLHETIEF